MHTDVTTTYMGMRLRSPLIVGSCPLTLKPEAVRELTISGAGAVVLPSILEEQIVREMVQQGVEASLEERQVEAAGSPKLEDIYNGGVDNYLRTLGMLKKCTGIPIIANVNGCPHGCWLDFAPRLEGAGADAIELSVQSSLGDPSQGAQAVEDALIAAVEKSLRFRFDPRRCQTAAVYHESSQFGATVGNAGAQGLVLFGREPIWEVFDGSLSATSRWSLSDSGQLQTTLSGLMRVRSGGEGMSIAASGGISTAKDVIHSVIAGADVAMVTSEIYRTGPDAVAHILEGVTQHFDRQGMHSFDEFVAAVARPERSGSASREPGPRHAGYRTLSRSSSPTSSPAPATSGVMSTQPPWATESASVPVFQLQPTVMLSLFAERSVSVGRSLRDRHSLRAAMP